MIKCLKNKCMNCRKSQYCYILEQIYEYGNYSIMWSD